jgi:hypothetical protein
MRRGAGYPRPTPHLDVIARTAALEQQMVVSRSDEGLFAHEGIAILGLSDRNGAESVEALGKLRGEVLRHVPRMSCGVTPP